MKKRRKTEKQDQSQQHKELRVRAEKQISQRVDSLRKQTAMTNERLIHELEVHQIELQMQNDELRRIQIELQAEKVRYFDLFDSAPIGYVILDEKGLVNDVNLTGAAMLGLQKQNLVKRSFSSFVARESKDSFYLHRNTVIGSSISQTCELKLRGKDGVEFDAQIISLPIADEPNSTNQLRVAIIDITERKKAEDKLIEYQTKLKELTYSILNTEDRVGQSIAMELHDNICQKLVMSKVNLESVMQQLPDDNLANSLKTASESIGEVIQVAYSMTYAFSNPILQEIGITAAIDKLLTEELERKHDITCRFKFDEHMGPLPKIIRSYLFRIIRELLMNIVKHADAHNATVTIFKNDGQVNVTVEDDGVGFDYARMDSNTSKGRKFGLFSIREQLEYLGGRLQIESEPERGTTVTVVVPAPNDSV